MSQKVNSSSYLRLKLQFAFSSIDYSWIVLQEKKENTPPTEKRTKQFKLLHSQMVKLLKKMHQLAFVELTILHKKCPVVIFQQLCDVWKKYLINHQDLISVQNENKYQEWKSLLKLKQDVIRTITKLCN